jgi:putative DNA primase/helicase
MSLLKAVFGDYAKQIPVQMILRSRADNQQAYRSELAGLRGRRFVCCEEPQEGAQYDEGTVKLLTGGGEVTGRAMRMDEVTFNANWLFEMAANSRPGWKADDALAGRYVEISWDFSILKTPGGVQEGFKKRLLAETSGFLNAILTHWTGETKPIKPELIERQTAIGNAAASPVAGFVRGGLIHSAEGKTYAADLYAGYLAWAKAPGSGVTVPLTPHKFGREIPRCGIAKDSDYRGTFYVGVTVHERYETGAFRMS